MVLRCKFSDWKYEDKETCLLLEGEVKVMQEGVQPVNFVLVTKLLSQQE